MDIYSKTSDTFKFKYKQLSAAEKSNSLESCEALYDYQNALLKEHDNNPNNSKYKKAIAVFRKEENISSGYFRKKVSVGGVLRKTPSNEIRSLDIHNIYKQYCAPKKEKIISPPKPTYKELEAENSKLKEQLAELQARREKDHEEFERHAKKIMARISA